VPVPENTYVVLDIPSPFAERVLAIREREQDQFRYSLPAETTVSGSSGTGPLAADEDLDRVIAVLDQVASGTRPIKSSFGPVRRFPDSDVFYLSFADERPLRALHQRFAASGLRFQPTPFPFGPHCTLRTRSPVTDGEAAVLFETVIDGHFTLDTLSLYDLPPRSAPLTGFSTLLCLLHLVNLTGPSPRAPRAARS
jgi:hypothetical protein